MQITIEQAELLKSLRTIEHTTNERSALPILANVLIEAKEEELVLTTTDLDVGVECRIPLTNKPECGALTVPAKKLTAIVQELPEEVVVIESKKNHAVNLSCGAIRFRIPGLPPEDFPKFPMVDEVEGIQLSQADLSALIAKTHFAMSTEEGRFILNGALLKLQDQTVTLVATDGRRLALADAKSHKTAGKDLRMVVPSNTIRALDRLLQHDSDDLVVIATLTDQQILFRFGQITLISRVLEGQFPQYEGILPAPSETTLTCDRQALLNAIHRVSLMTTATSQAVVFDLEKERLIISKESPELGSAREELIASYTGQPMTIAFNPGFWLDVLKVLDVDALTIELAAPDKPAVIRAPGFLHMALPMKLA